MKSLITNNVIAVLSLYTFNYFPEFFRLVDKLNLNSFDPKVNIKAKFSMNPLTK